MRKPYNHGLPFFLSLVYRNASTGFSPVAQADKSGEEMPSLAAVAGGQIALGCDTRMTTAGQARGVKAREDSSVSTAIAASGPMVSHTLNRINDADLIREAQRGSRTAFEELVRQYDQAVLRLALHLTGSEAEAQDIYQEAFLKAYRHLGNFRFECSFYTWMYRIVTNLCRSEEHTSELQSQFHLV